MTSFINGSARIETSYLANILNNPSIKSSSTMNSISSAENLQAENIEVVPELPFNDDSEDDYSEFSEDNGEVNICGNSFEDEEDEPFDEYAYQVKSNHYESDAVWFDNSRLKTMDLSSLSADDNVIEIDSDDDDFDDDFGDNEYSSGLTNTADDTGDEKANTCDICHRKVASSYNLKRHMMIHTGEKPFSCEICERRFREFSDLKKHRKIHNGETLFKCSSCNVSRPINRGSSKCIDCEKRDAIKKAQLAISPSPVLQRSDGNNKRSFVCSYCQRVFGSSSNLKRHIMIHTGEKPFSCRVCQRSFREMSTLKKHSFTHRKENGFILKSATSREISVTHSANTNEINTRPPIEHHSSEKTFHTCPICNEVCLGSDALIAHCFSHKQKVKENASKEIPIRKFTKSPPPLIPINRAAFKIAVRHSNNLHIGNNK